MKRGTSGSATLSLLFVDACSNDFTALQSGKRVPTFDDDAGVSTNVKTTRDADRKDAADARVDAPEARFEASDAPPDAADAGEAERTDEVPIDLRMDPPYPTSQVSPSPGG